MKTQRSLLQTLTVNYILYKDPSNIGWGASDTDLAVNGRWSETEKTLNKNCFKLLAIKFAVKALLSINIYVLCLITLLALLM